VQVSSDSDSDVMMVGKQQQQQKRRAVFGDITNVSALFIFILPVDLVTYIHLNRISFLRFL